MIPATVRPMQADDLERVLALAALLPEAPHWSRTAYEAALDPQAQPRRIALIAEIAGEIAGFAVVSLIAGEAELESIAVSAASQRQGLGRLLLTAAAAKAQTLGAQRMLLEVRASNQRALAFYRELGWSETGRRPRYYQQPQEDALLFCRELAQ